jgi:hypothetical protein
MANIAYDDTIGASTITYEEWSDYVDANGWGTSLGKGADENIKRNYWDKYIAPAGTITFPDGRVAKITEDTTEDTTTKDSDFDAFNTWFKSVYGKDATEYGFTSENYKIATNENGEKWYDLYSKTSPATSPATSPTTSSTITDFDTSIPAFPTTEPPTGYYWSLVESNGAGLGGWEWVPTYGGDNAPNLQAQALEEAKFAYQKEYDEWQKAQTEKQMEFEREKSERDFQLTLERMYTDLQKNPSNWIVASEFLQRIRPGEAATLTTPKWLAKFVEQNPGSELQPIQYTVPSGKDWGDLTPTQRAMFGGYSTWIGGPGEEDIAYTVGKSLPQSQEKTGKWKPAFQV